MDAFEIKGKWWLPEEPDQQVAGLLRFDGIQLPTLELFGTFKGSADLHFRPNIIWGITSTAKPVTLYNSFAISVPVSMSSSYSETQIYSTFLVQGGFIGDFFEKLEDIYFNVLNIKYFNLSEWARISRIQWSITITDSEDLKIENRPLDTNANVSDLVITLRHRFAPYRALTEFSVKQETYISIESKELKSFSELEEIFHKISLFLSLGLSQATYPLSIEAFRDEHKPPVSIFYAPNLDSTALQAKPIPAYRMLFKFEDILDNFEIYVQNWFSKAKELEPVYELYIVTLLRPAAVIEQRFLNLVQALETYHRRVHPNSTYRRLEDRLKDLLSEHKETKYLNSLAQSPSDFEHRVTGARDWFTHYDEKNRQFKPDNQTLWEMIQNLQFVMEVCLLTELGIAEAKIEELMKRVVKNRFQAD